MKNRKGFTIVELVIVIAVIAILAAVLIPTFSGVVQRANESAALQKAPSAMKTVLAQSDNATIANGSYFISGNKDIDFIFKYDLNKISENNLKSDWNKGTKTTYFTEKTVTNSTNEKLNTIIVPVNASGDTSTPSDGVLDLITVILKGSTSDSTKVSYQDVARTNGIISGAPEGKIPEASVKYVVVGEGENAQYYGVLLNVDFAKDIVCLTYSK